MKVVGQEARAMHLPKDLASLPQCDQESLAIGIAPEDAPSMVTAFDEVANRAGYWIRNVSRVDCSGLRVASPGKMPTPPAD